jgi:hypothetical protein
MLTIELNGKSISTADNKQTIRINDNPVEIERVGDAIYVNKIAINLIVVDKKTSFTKKAVSFVAGAAVVAAVALAAANYDVVISIFNSAVQTVQPYTDGVLEYVTGNEATQTEAITPVE